MEATVGTVTDAGGTIAAAPFEIPGGARVAVVTDRTGAMFALISGGPEPDQAYYSERIGGVCWAELMTSSLDDAVEFYHQVFGWDAKTDASGPTPYTTCRLGTKEVAGMISRPAGAPPEVPDSWSVYFTVGSCADTVKRATELGGAVILPATPTPMGPFAVIADPMGAAFQIMQIQEMATTEAD
jgi:predicted enzyme related to lactoylglutathione lyase